MPAPQPVVQQPVVQQPVVQQPVVQPPVVQQPVVQQPVVQEPVVQQPVVQQPVVQQPVVQAPVEQQPIVQQPVAPPPVMATPAPTPEPPPPAAPLEANIATAQSGAVPYKDIKSPPFDGNLQVAVIQFGRGSSGLDGVDYSVLQKVAEIQRSNRATVRIVAHSAQDAYGSSVSDLARANYEVSRRRALAVANQLVRLGVPVDRIVAEAASDSEPVYATNTARGVAANRRADIFVDF